jgi:negative regulator of flagellin synthesis FlgM
MAIQFNNIGPGTVRDGARSPASPGSSDVAREAPAAEAESVVALSEGAQLLRSASERLANVPEVDESRVEAIRDAIAAGRYHVDPVRLAERFIELESKL